MRGLVIILSVCGLVLIGSAVEASARAQGAASELTGVVLVEPGELAATIASARRIVIFDVRAPAEYRVSRLKGAIRISPDIEAVALIARFSSRVKDAVVVFYCAVGTRSNEVAERSADDLRRARAIAILVLDAGIIGWANNRLPLVNAKGPTILVHAYDRDKAKLLKDPAIAVLPKNR